MKINFTYLTMDSKAIMFYEVIYIYKPTIQKYYFKVRLGRIIYIIRNKQTKKSKIYTYKDSFKMKID